MISLLSILFYLFLLLLLYLAYQKSTRPPNLPPGPLALPIIGSLPWLWLTGERLHHKQFQALAKRYGDTYFIRLGRFNVLYVGGSHENILESLKNPDFAGRPLTLSALQLRAAGERALVFNEGEVAMTLRKMAQRTVIHALSERHQETQDLLCVCANLLTEKFTRLAGKPVKTWNVIMECVGCVMLKLVFDRKPDPDDPFLQVLWSKGFKFVEPHGPFEYLPVFLSRFRPGIKQQTTQLNGYITCVQNEIDQKFTEMGLAPKGNSSEKRCAAEFAYDFFEHLQPGHKPQINEDEVRITALEIFRAGVFDMTEALEWFLYILATHLDVQAKIHRELDTFPKGHLVDASQDMLDSLPFTRACVAEMLRYVMTPPLGMPHKALTDSTFKQWRIPKGTMIWNDLHAASHDKEVYPDPDTYKPERWLHPETGAFDAAAAKAALTFAPGRRRCPGERLAKVELFTMIANIMRGLSVRLAWEESSEYNQTSPYTIGAPNHRIIFKARD